MASKPFLDKRYGTWYMQYRPDPAKGWVKVRLGPHGSPYPANRPPAKPPERIRELAAEYEQVEARAKAGVGAPRRTDLSRYLAAWQDGYGANRRAGSLTNVRRTCRDFLAWAKGRGVSSVEDVTRQVCREYLAHRIAIVSAGTLRSERGRLSPIWTQAVADEIVQVNPWAATKIPGKVTHADPTFWTTEQVAAIVAASDGWFRDLILVLANTGVRISATLAMEWGWVDWAAGLIRVPREHDKGRKGYAVALNDVARDVLQRRNATSAVDLVFPSQRGKPWTYSTAEKRFTKAVKKAGVPHGTPHDLRHTYGRLLARVAPITVVQASLGHASLAMTQRYTSVSGEEGVSYMEGFGVGVVKEEG